LPRQFTKTQMDNRIPPSLPPVARPGNDGPIQAEPHIALPMSPRHPTPSAAAGPGPLAPRRAGAGTAGADRATRQPLSTLSNTRLAVAGAVGGLIGAGGIAGGVRMLRDGEGAPAGLVIGAAALELAMTAGAIGSELAQRSIATVAHRPTPLLALLHDASEALAGPMREAPSELEVRQALDHLRDLNSGAAERTVQDAAAQATNGQELAEAMVALCRRDTPVLPRGEARRRGVSSNPDASSARPEIGGAERGDRS
jgi:hypothetical protein